MPCGRCGRGKQGRYVQVQLIRAQAMQAGKAYVFPAEKLHLCPLRRGASIHLQKCPGLILVHVRKDVKGKICHRATLGSTQCPLSAISSMVALKLTARNHQYKLYTCREDPSCSPLRWYKPR